MANTRFNVVQKHCCVGIYTLTGKVPNKPDLKMAKVLTGANS